MFSLYDTSIDVIDKILYDFAPNEDIKKLHKKYNIDSKLINDYDLINNRLLHSKVAKSFIGIVDAIKIIRGYIFEIYYLQSKTEVQIITNSDQELLDDLDRFIDTIVNLDETFLLLRMFRDLNVIKDDTPETIKFIELIRDMEKATELSEEEKEDCHRKIDFKY